ncbi:MAG TPA: hypothetical protein VK843_12995 [Planctomycetota bacterium]|nr:hypothetical protein [Planctomycetota bacterium]
MTADLPLLTKYVFRGAVLNDRPVLQPDLFLTFADERQSMTVGVFGNLETSGEHDRRGEFTEIDYTLDYGRSTGPLDWTIGVAHYEYPRMHLAGSSESYVIVSYRDVLITPSLEWWHDFDEVDGSYLNFQLSHSFGLGEDWSLDVMAGAGFMDANQAAYYFGVDRSGLSDALAQCVLARHLGATTLSLGLAYTSVLDPDLRDGASDPDNVIGTLAINFGY